MMKYVCIDCLREVPAPFILRVHAWDKGDCSVCYIEWDEPSLMLVDEEILTCLT